MKAIIYNSISKNRNCAKIAEQFNGDFYEVKPKKIINSVVLQMIVYGFKTVFSKSVDLSYDKIDFDQYDEIILISPVYAGRVNCFMRQYLSENKFDDKKVIIIGSAGGNKNPKFFSSFEPLINNSNSLIKNELYVGTKKEN